MGNASSKAARKLPTRPPPTWAGARTAPKDAPVPPAHASRASEVRTADIEKDARDPDFLANLQKLGPVKIDHGARTQLKREEDPQISNINRLFQSRAASEEEAASFHLAKNHLFAGALHDLLNERKSARTKQDLEKLGAKYGIEVSKIETLAKFLNSPSVDKNSTTKTVDKDGEEILTFPAVWVEPRLHA